MGNKYFNLETKDKKADLFIYGDITSWPWKESDVSSYNLSKQLEELKNIEILNVYINSYGGEVGEGLAIYNALKRFKGKVITYADGFVCSIASVIFMAGEERIMNQSSALLIHNAWTYESGDAKSLRKAADDLDVINELSVKAYLEKISLKETELREYMDKETWIDAENAISLGFATSLEENKSEKANQSYKTKLVESVLNKNIFQAVTSVTISIQDGELKISTNEEDSSETDTITIDNNGDDSSDDTETNDETLNDSQADKNKQQSDFKEKILRVFEGGDYNENERHK